jgi:excisionase family DNA binding protein
VYTREWLTLDEAAVFLYCHPATVVALVKRGALPGYKIGRDWRFQIEDVAALIPHA